MTLPQSYSDLSYDVFVSMRDTNPASFSVSNSAVNAFTIYWANAGGGAHDLGWMSAGS